MHRRCIGLRRIDRCRDLRRHLSGRFVFPQPLECGLTHLPIRRPSREFDFGNAFRFHPMDVGRLFRCAHPGKGRTGHLQRRQPFHQHIRSASAETGTDTADMDEVLVAMDTDQKRSKPSVGCRVTADDHFMTCPALGFYPAITPTGLIRRIRLL